MNREHINPFLESSMFVLEQMCQIRPSVGSPTVKLIQLEEGPVWLKISVVGDMEGDILYCFPKSVALKLVSDMMGGFVITELDEIGHSAIAELGNMISGNASTIMFNNGITIDITPPSRMLPSSDYPEAKVIVVPLMLDGVGEVDIYVNFRSKKAS